MNYVIKYYARLGLDLGRAKNLTYEEFCDFLREVLDDKSLKSQLFYKDDPRSDT